MTDDQLTTPREEAEVASATEVVETAPTEDAIEAASDPAPVAVAEEPVPAVEEPAPVAEVPEAVVEAPAEPVPAPVVNTTTSANDQDLFEAAMAELSGGDVASDSKGSTQINKGDRVEAKVILVEKERVFVDLGTKAEAILPLNELADSNVTDANDVVKVGDTFDVIVLRTSSSEGGAIVSKKKADFDIMWQNILDAHENQTPIEAPVVDRVKGGLVVDIGVRGFVPATHVGNGKIRNLDRFVGQPLTVKIIEVDKERKKVVLSNRAAESEVKDAMKEKLFNEVKVGDVLEGTVRRLTDYGAFVDLGGMDGLLHISEMSWVRIDHPREVLKVGDTMNVKVLRLDSETGRISLGLRQVLPDPWNLVKENYRVGGKIKVTVGRIVQSGAFIKMPEGIEAFLPLSEMSDKRIKSADEAIEAGQEIEPTIIDLRPEDRRMVLSLRENAQFGTSVDYRMPGAASGGRRPMGGGGRPGQRPGGNRRRDNFDQPQNTQRAPSTGATIGERLGMLKGILKNDEAGEAPAAETTAKEAPEATPEATPEA